MKKYAELSVGVYKQHRNNEVTCSAYLQRDRDA